MLFLGFLVVFAGWKHNFRFEYPEHEQITRCIIVLDLILVDVDICPNDLWNASRDLCPVCHMTS